jgi:hypothetical protein
VALNPALPTSKMLVFVLLLAVLGTSQCLEFAPQKHCPAAGTLILPTRRVISTYLKSEWFLSIIFNKFLPKIVINFKALTHDSNVPVLCSF